SPVGTTKRPRAGQAPQGDARNAGPDDRPPRTAWLPAEGARPAGPPVDLARGHAEGGPAFRAAVGNGRGSGRPRGVKARTQGSRRAAAPAQSGRRPSRVRFFGVGDQGHRLTARYVPCRPRPSAKPLAPSRDSPEAMTSAPPWYSARIASSKSIDHCSSALR